MLPSNGTFDVKYEDGNAVLSWPKPAGDYTRQVIEKWTNNKRQKRAVESECQRNPECTEHDLTKDQTSLTIPVEHHEYNFMLVLFDGNIPVSIFPSQVVTDPTKSKFTVKHILLFQQKPHW